MAASFRSRWPRICGSHSRAGPFRCSAAPSPRTSSRSCMRSSRRLEQIPPYLFAELERKIAEKKAKGVDVISLGIGDPDTPTYAPIVEALQEAVKEAETHQ